MGDNNISNQRVWFQGTLVNQAVNVIVVSTFWFHRISGTWNDTFKEEKMVCMMRSVHNKDFPPY